MTTLQDVAGRVKKIREQAKLEGQALLKEAFDAFFKKHPQASSIAWTQYTPHFNDGDACVFRMNDFELHVSKEGMEELNVPEQIIEDVVQSQGERYSYGEGCLSAACRFHNDYKTPGLIDWSKPKFAQLKELLDDFSTLADDCRSVEDVVMQPVFGDHVLIEATRSGFSIDDYDHD